MVKFNVFVLFVSLAFTVYVKAAKNYNSVKV